MAEFDFSKAVNRYSAYMRGEGGEVPFIAQFHEFAMRESGISGDEFYTDARQFVRGICQISEKFGFDTPSFIWDIYNVEAEALGCDLVTFRDMAPAIENASPLVTCEADLARLKAPDPQSAGRYPMVFKILEEVKAQTGMTPLPCFCAPFTLASHVLSFENLIVQIQQNPGFVHRLLDFLVDEVIAPYMNALIKAFPESTVVEGSDAVASLPFITQEMLESFALAPLERLAARLDRPMYCDNWWGDSFARDLHGFWAQKLRVTPDYLKVQDPDLFKIGVQPVVDFARSRKLPIVLGVDNNVLQNGPESEIRRRIHDYMEAIEEVGRGALYLCSLSAVTPAQNVRIAIEACKDFRRGKRPWAGQRRAGGAGRSGPESAEVKEEEPQAASDAPASEKPEWQEELLDQIFDAVMDRDDVETVQGVKEALGRKLDVQDILDEGLIAAMDEIGEEFSDGVIFVPEMLMSARAMKAGLEVVRPILTRSGEASKGKVLLATVQGDVHDIGKNLVAMMLEGAGFEVVDLGVNKTPDEILELARRHEPDVVGLSALLTTSMPALQKTVRLFKSSGSKYPVVVGGAPVTDEFALRIRADGFGENAPHAVEVINRIVAGGAELRV